jgi:hypothetical protein
MKGFTAFNAIPAQYKHMSIWITHSKYIEVMKRTVPDCGPINETIMSARK